MYKLLFATTLAALPLPALAHAALISSTPAAGASVSRPDRITLKFDEALKAGTAGAEIVMTAMPGMTDHPPMAIKAFTVELADKNETMVLVLRKPLAAGTYTVNWSGANDENHRSKGSIEFSVK